MKKVIIIIASFVVLLIVSGVFVWFQPMVHTMLEDNLIIDILCTA